MPTLGAAHWLTGELGHALPAPERFIHGIGFNVTF